MHRLQHGKVCLAATSVFDALTNTDRRILEGRISEKALHERRLADSGGARDEHDPALALTCHGDEASEANELAVAPDGDRAGPGRGG